MRKIKFRGWDEGNKVMHHDFQFFTSGENGNDWICFSSDKELRKTDNPMGIIFNNPYFRQQIKIMQFTGLLDKNGKEIYEGDILSFTGLPAFHRTPFIIEWNDKKAGWTDYSPKDKAEIIGNIYENPELSEVK